MRIVERPERAPRASIVDAAVLVLLGAVVLVVFVDRRHALPEAEGRVDLAPTLLPLYAAYSLARMVAAYAASLGFALAAGAWAARSLRARRLILPALDVLQSVPILGFFPAAVSVGVGLFHHSVLGVEAAAVFLIFTSQAWNLAFSVYASLTTVPDDLDRAVRLSGAAGVVRWRRLLLPACVPGLVYNSMLSWAAGWYFLMASEIITVGPRTYTLEGLGSYIGEAIAQGRSDRMWLGLVALTLVIVLLHIVVWSPLQFWSQRFRYEYAASGPTFAEPLARSIFWRAPLLRRAWVGGARAVERAALAVGAHLQHRLTSREVTWVLAALAAGGLAVLAPSAVRQAAAIATRPLSAHAYGIPEALGFSMLRLVLAYLVSLAWTLPAAWWLGRSPARMTRAMPVLQIAASLPATALFPIVVHAVETLGLDFNVASVVLVVTGMQWYLLFNLVAGAQAMPADLRELARATGVGGWLYVRRFFLPVAMPALATGSLTAWGGGWNALILGEYVVVDGHVHTVRGIGALLDEATYRLGDLQLVTLTVMSMVVAILVLNRLVWRPLEDWAHARYRLES